MDLKVFKKLEMDLPRQSTIDERPWFITGLLYALLILLMIAGAYLQERDKRNLHDEQDQKIQTR